MRKWLGADGLGTGVGVAVGEGDGEGSAPSKVARLNQKMMIQATFIDQVWAGCF